MGIYENRPHENNILKEARIIESLDKEASRLGVTRQSIIKIWLAERLDAASHQQW
jgi:hypothetical protein